MQALEVGDLRLVARLGEHLEAGHDQRRRAAAENGLLAEQVGLGLLGEGRAEHAGLGAADPLGVRQGQLQRGPRGVLLHGDQARHAAAVDELAAHEVAGALRRHHGDVDAGRRGDETEADVQPVSEQQRVAVLQVRRDVGLVELALHRVRREDHDHVGLGGGLGGSDDAQALRLGLRAALRALRQADAHVDAGVAQGQRMGVPLAAVAEDGHLPAADEAEVGVVVVVDLGHEVGVLLLLQVGGRQG